MLSPKLQSQSSSHKSGYGHVAQPPGSMEYVTSSKDTLQSIAVAFDTTTTKLMKLNKLSSLTIFPGQALFVPCDEAQASSSMTQKEERNAVTRSSNSWDLSGDYSFLSPLSPSSTVLDREFKDLMVVSNKPTTMISNNQADIKNAANAEEKRERFRSSEKQHVQKQSHDSNDRKRVMSGESTESEPFEEGFLKMSVSYITDSNEMVSGVLLVTPSALMFDPESSDPVVIRDGCSDYGIMCPMSRITSVAMYNDTTRRKQNSTKSIEPVENLMARPRITSRDSSTSSATTTEAEAKLGDDEDELEIPELPLDETVLPSSPHKMPFTLLKNTNTLYEVKTPVPGTAKPAIIAERDCQESELTRNVVPNLERKVGKEEQSERKLEEEFPFWHTVVKAVGDWIPNYSLTKSDNSAPTSGTFDPDCNHMYLCIRSKQKMVKTFSLSEDDGDDHSSCDDKSSEDKKYPEYWFKVPRKKSDLLYAFFLQWSPENRCPAAELGFVVLEEDMDCTDGNEATKSKIRTVTNSSLEFVDDFYDESYSYEKEWEIISIQEAKRRSIAFNAFELAEADDSLIPELEKPSTLLNDTTLLALCKSLPNRCIGYSWSPVYTTSDHGTSLKTMYRNMGNSEAPVVFIIRDTNDYIFGALCSSAPKISDHYFGTGESFLFTIEPEFQVFKWTGENNFFIKGDTDSFTMGGGKGTCGLWLDSDLYHGSSRPCNTFANKVLASEEDFVIQSIEAWMIKDI